MQRGHAGWAGLIAYHMLPQECGVVLCAVIGQPKELVVLFGSIYRPCRIVGNGSSNLVGQVTKSGSEEVRAGV